MQFESLKKTYLDREKLLSISGQITDQPTAKLMDTIEQQGTTIAALANQIKQLEKWKVSVEKDRKFIRRFREEVKWFKEGNIIVHYTSEIPKEELKEIVEEAKQGKLKPRSADAE